jgi:hypothetical protein
VGQSVIVNGDVHGVVVICQRDSCGTFKCLD